MPGNGLNRGEMNTGARPKLSAKCRRQSGDSIPTPITSSIANELWLYAKQRGVTPFLGHVTLPVLWPATSPSCLPRARMVNLSRRARE